ncbi:hypothetical protein OJF2_22340 [Aquisphaera giovannonii]|uniref:Uncharacterized protein n=1 Tax=Aquisphaera giovannonii TaxID=406548 RepID=A0A5B9VZK6_9BACT|nr:hypothetical protein OJF2_22340 [Aquisphaera giovannonii]
MPVMPPAANPCLAPGRTPNVHSPVPVMRMVSAAPASAMQRITETSQPAEANVQAR